MLYNLGHLMNSEYYVGLDAIPALGLNSAAELEAQLKNIIDSIKTGARLPATTLKLEVRPNVYQQYLYARLLPSPEVSRLHTAISQHVSSVGMGWQLGSNGNGFRMKYV